MEAHVNELVDFPGPHDHGPVDLSLFSGPQPSGGSFRLPTEQVNQGLICLQSLRREPRRVLRKSEPSKVAFSSIFPVRKPLPKGV
jgi:hypothetical protein